MREERIPARHISVVYNGVDTHEFAPADQRDRLFWRRQLDLPEKGLVIARWDASLQTRVGKTI